MIAQIYDRTNKINNYKYLSFKWFEQIKISYLKIEKKRDEKGKCFLQSPPPTNSWFPLSHLLLLIYDTKRKKMPPLTSPCNKFVQHIKT